MNKQERPKKPKDDKPVWYRGWEITYSAEAEAWTGAGWQACNGGGDLDCEFVNAEKFCEVLDEIENREEGA